MNSPLKEIPGHLLIVDDDESLARTLTVILSKVGYRLSTCASAVAAVTLVKENPSYFACALIDLQLPDKSGLALMKELKLLAPDLGVLMLTGHANIETAVEALNAGAFAYLQKPYNIDEVKATLLRFMEKKKLLLENQNLLDQMVQLNAELDEKVRRRTLELQTANLALANTVEELRRADAIRSDFIAMISHELRTPLTGIIGFAQALAMHLEKLDQQKMKQYLGVIDMDAHRLLRLIEGILDLSTISKSGLTLKPSRFHLKPMIEEVVERFRVTHQNRQVTMFFSEPLTEIYTDSDRLNQILVNLLENAFKYSPKEDLVHLRVSRQEDDLILKVVDSGPGIPNDQKIRIFEAFYRTHDAINMRAPGTGLGLTICKAIVEAGAGHIWVEDVLPHGCAFTVQLPRVFLLK